MKELSVTVSVVQDEDIPENVNILIGLPKEQETMSVRQITHLLVGGISMMVKSCSNTDMGIKDYELMEEVISHLNLEFSSIKSYNDVYVDKKLISKENE